MERVATVAVNMAASKDFKDILSPKNLKITGIFVGAMLAR
jgi:hypothetical protein